MAQDDRLKEYMEKLERLTGALPDEKALRKLQLECKLEPGDLKKLDMLVERHNDRADIYLHRDNVSGAIEELERACQLTPRDPFLHLNLAKLYKNRYENYGFLRRDRDRTIEEAQKTISLDSSLTEPAELMKEVELLHKRLRGEGEKTRPVVLIALLSLLLLIMLLFSWRKSIVEWVNRRLNPPQEVAYTPPKEIFNPAVPHETAVESYGFVDNNLEFSIQSSRVLPVNDHWGYELQGSLKSPALAINGAELELRFLNSADQLIYQDSLLLKEKAPLLPGETLPVDLFFYIPFSPEEIDSLSVTPVSLDLIPPPPVKSSSVKIYWEGEKPEGIKLSLEEREFLTREGYDRNVHYYTFDLRQKGRENIGKLELTFRWKDNFENIQKTRTLTPVRADGPYMEGGESRSFSFKIESEFSVDWDSLYYEVTVTDVLLTSQIP